MIEQTTKEIKHLIAEFQTKENKKQLVSMTCKMTNTNALDTYKLLMEMYTKSLYWQSADRTEYIMGLGSVKELRDTHSNLRKIETQWRNLCQEAIVANHYDIPGVGLIIMGGMPFDPKDDCSPLWSDFQGTSFVIPELSITQNTFGSFLTFNHWVEEETEIIAMYEKLQYFLSYCQNHESTKATTDKNTIQMKHEVAINQWHDMIERAKDTIATTEIEKIVLARELQIQFARAINIPDVLEQLDQTEDNSYLFHFKKGNSSFVGATPERLVKVTEQDVLSTCLAGTAPRGETTASDKEIRDNLLNDAKNLEEHEYVVQMIEQALRPYCKNINLPKKPVIFPLSQLQHLYTPVTAKLCETKRIFNLVTALHPTPALGGTPKKRALEYIRKHEPLDRGWYGAPVGWVDAKMNGEFAVALRSALIQADKVSLFAGCGIVKDSCPELEYEETKIKFMSMLKALGG